MAHTRGPWFADYGDFDVFDENGACVARAVDGQRDSGDRIGAVEHEANLNLIAASPELLEACAAALDWAASQDDELAPEWVEQLVAAVALATSGGRS